MNRQFSIATVLILCCVGVYAHAEEGKYPAGTPYFPADKGTYEGGFVPTPPDPFPEAYKDYQILPFSTAPNKQYGLIYPQRSTVYTVEKPRLLLAALKPFRVLVEIPLRHSLQANANGYYVANWATNSAAITVIEGKKWGPDTVYLIPIQGDRAGKITDLTAQVVSQVLPDFKKWKARPFDENYNFIFDSEGRVTGNGVGTILSEKGWQPTTQRQVIIDCTCTTEPRSFERDVAWGRVWTVRFQGVWDIAKERFTRKTFVRISLMDNESAPRTDEAR